MSKALSIILMLAILGTIGALVYVTVTPRVEEGFTEFYILGPEGKAENYPTEIALGEEGRVFLGIVNREHREVKYRMEVRIEKVTNKEVEPGVLAHEEKWEEGVSFIPTRVGENKEVEFILYKDGQDGPYLTLYLWIEVKGQ